MVVGCSQLRSLWRGSFDAALLEVLPPAQREPFMKALHAVVRALEERSV
jgi:hypothetical protein